jgi:hypothetical protein
MCFLFGAVVMPAQAGIQSPAGGRSGQERRFSAQAGDYWIVRLRGR